jgi:hypothetical protein
MSMPSRAVSSLLGTGAALAAAAGVELLASRGDAIAAEAGMSQAEISMLHAALFFATVWIVSSLRIHRLQALWRVGLGRKVLRGASGSLQPRGPKARAATGGSVGGAGASGNAGRRRRPAVANDNSEPAQLIDNFRG